MAKKPTGHTAEAPELPSGGSVDFNALNDALAAGTPAGEAVAGATVGAAAPIEPRELAPGEVMEDASAEAPSLSGDRIAAPSAD